MAAVAPNSAIEYLEKRPHEFLRPTPAIHAALLRLAEQFLDPLAADVTDVQLQRQRLERQSRKRKRSRPDTGSVEELLRMRKVHIDGFAADQVWQQARRVLDATVAEVERSVPRGEPSEDEDGDGDERNGTTLDVIPESALDFDATNEDDETDAEKLDDDGVATDQSFASEQDEDDFDEPGNGLLNNEQEDGTDTPLSDYSDEEGIALQNTMVQDKHGLNDGFFSIDDFNKQTQFLEDQDVRGDPNDGAASDEEDVDWEADPMLAGVAPTTDARPTRRTAGDAEDDEDDESGSEGGPTFGNMDLNAPENASDDNDDFEGQAPNMVESGMADFSNTNDIMYRDFFEAPAKAANRAKKQRKPISRQSKNETTLVTEDGDALDEIEMTMARVNRDLFADDEASEAEDSNLPEDSKNANLSTHEKKQLALRAEIRRLEAANVAPKDWSLQGEAAAPARPMNSLLEEDLEFERTGKPVPIITSDVNESLEQLIKRRIIAKEFDEVIRRRPTDLVNGADPRRGRMREELSDVKSTKGLAEEYEQDQLRRTDPNYMDSRSEALKKTHREIEAQWASISAQLDALSNWHYKPRPPAASLDVRIDAPTITMEDARPSAGGEVGGASRLAPQELYRPGEDGKIAGEVHTRGGMPVSKDEESRELKKRRRRREKERGKKANENKELPTRAATAVGKEGKKAPRKDVVAQLKKGGVKVVDAKGRMRDVDGARASGQSARRDGGNYKL